MVEREWGGRGGDMVKGRGRDERGRGKRHDRERMRKLRGREGIC